MILKSPGDIAFTLFDFPVYYYGIILASACLIAVIVAKVVYSIVYKDGKSDFIWDTAPFVIILGIIGARLYYCSLNFDYYWGNPLEILYIRGGGLSIHGGIIAGILGLWIASFKYKISFLRLLDVFSVGTILAQSIGRWGNFFNNEAFGLPANGFLKLFIPLSDRPSGFVNYHYYHPAFLYESVADLFIFFILLFVIKKFGVKIEGLTLSLYLILYSLVRFVIEELRLDSALNVGDFHIAQIISLIIFAAGLILLSWLLYKNKTSQT